MPIAGFALADRRRELLETVFREAVNAVHPRVILADGAWMQSISRPLSDYARIVAICLGKAGLSFASVIAGALGEHLDGGVAVVPHGYLRAWSGPSEGLRSFHVMTAAHPVPDEAGAEASECVLGFADGLGRDDLAIVCVSGGGSALLPAPPPGVTVGDVRMVHAALIRSGAPIDEINTVRRALSRIAGGRLAAAAAPAEVVGLVQSDVPGDDMSTVASGPITAPKESGEDAIRILDRLGIVPPPAITRVLAGGGITTAGVTAASVQIAGCSADLVHAACRAARHLGLRAVPHEESLQGESSAVGRALAILWRDSGDGPVLHAIGGETTVTVTGSGTGGRNQEVALAGALALDEFCDAEWAAGRTILAAGSDGIDGPTAAAGAVCDARTVRHGERVGLSAARSLADNDSHGFFRRVGGLVVTGPTHVNVMDLALVLQDPPGFR